MRKDMIDYYGLVDEAMHVIVFKVLKNVEASGLPGDHHFFISFSTQAEGVKLSENLRIQYPNSMTIVLQYQYKDLFIDNKGFGITLSFSGKQESIYIPFSSILAFNDPSVQFDLRFRQSRERDKLQIEFIDGIPITISQNEKSNLSTNQKNPTTNNIIPFDQLRRKNRV